MPGAGANPLEALPTPRFGPPFSSHPNQPFPNLILQNENCCNRKESPLDVVSGRWSEDLAKFYTFIEGTSDLDLDLKRIQEERPRIVQLLNNHTQKSQRRADRN